MNKIFEKIDTLPIVRLLQVVAVLIFIFGLVAMFVSKHIWQTSFPDNVMVLIMSLTNILHQPVILLALAEIIKLMRKKK